MSVAVLLIAVILAHPPNSGAYGGGPVKAVLAGFDPTEGKVFYWLYAYDESGDPPQAFYFDLCGETPAKPIRAGSLEQPPGPQRSSEASERWKRLSNRLVPLRPLADFEMAFSVVSDSTGTDPTHGVTRYSLDIHVKAKTMTRDIQVTGYCRPVARIHGLYAVPGRTELIAVLSYIGREYGCEEVDVPLVFEPSR